MARTKKRAQNHVLLTKKLDDLVVDDKKSTSDTLDKVTDDKSSENIVQPTTAVKRGRGCPKNPLLNTKKLLTL